MALESPQSLSLIRRAQFALRDRQKVDREGAMNRASQYLDYVLGRGVAASASKREIREMGEGHEVEFTIEQLRFLYKEWEHDTHSASQGSGNRPSNDRIPGIGVELRQELRVRVGENVWEPIEDLADLGKHVERMVERGQLVVDVDEEE